MAPFKCNYYKKSNKWYGTNYSKCTKTYCNEIVNSQQKQEKEYSYSSSMFMGVFFYNSSHYLLGM